MRLYIFLKYFSLASIILAANHQTSLASPLAELNSFIPIESIRPEATDLIFNNQHLLPQEASALRNQGYDISTIDPDASTSVWSPNPTEVVDDTTHFTVNSSDTVQYLRTVPSPAKIFRFTIRSSAADGVERIYTVFLSKRSQTYLLRRNLLRKLGYIIPPMKRLERLRIEFRSTIEKENFISDKDFGLRWNALGDKEWILNLEDKTSTFLELQDIVLYEAQEYPVNLSSGVIRPDINQGRRIINALLVPYNLVDVRESVNGFRWHSAQIKSNAIYMPLEDQEGFTTTLSDARWIMRKIINLSRKDWEEIVSYNTGYPEAAQKLLTEKLISRRNELRRILSLPGEDILFNPSVTFGSDLVEGELIKAQWSGLAPSLSMGEEPSLVSGGELTALFKSKFISTAIGELVQKVNKDFLPNTDLAQKAMEAQQERFIKDFKNFIKTGKFDNTGMGIWTAPYFQAQLIASREVVAGSYLGTDNRVQQADTFGVGIDTGLYFGTTGLKAGQFLDANTKVYYYRQYSHLKPLTSIKNALFEPYTNILVPLLKRKWAGLIDPDAFELKEGETEDDLKKRLQTIVKEFKDHLGDGESLIISDSLGANANIRAGYELTDRIRAQAEFGGSQVYLWRLHILRAGDNIHIYKDFGNLKSLQFVISLRGKIEVLNLRTKFSKGEAKTDFFLLHLNDDLNQNPDLPLILGGIHDILLNNSTQKIRLFREPHTLRHKLQERQSEFNFLVWNNFKLKNRDSVTIQRSHEQDPEHYVRRLIGTRSGKDYQSLGIDILNALIEDATNEDINFANSNSGDSGDTLFGKSKARYSYFEGELVNNEYSEMFVGVIYRWKGWSAKRNELKEIVADFSKRYSFEFFHPQAFEQIKKAELYNLNLRVFIYDRGVRKVLGLTEVELANLLDKHSSANKNRKLEHKTRVLKAFSWLKGQYKKYLKKSDNEKLGDIIVRMISLLETSLDHKGLLIAVGGEKNILIQPILQGFLQGEDGKMAELPIEGNEIGEVGSDRPYGPLTSTQTELGMSESEFFVYWLLRKI